MKLFLILLIIYSYFEINNGKNILIFINKTKLYFFYNCYIKNK